MKSRPARWGNTSSYVHEKCIKLYKIPKSENRETWRRVVLSHVEAMVKIWEDLEQVTVLNV